MNDKFVSQRQQVALCTSLEMHSSPSSGKCVMLSHIKSVCLKHKFECKFELYMRNDNRTGIFTMQIGMQAGTQF